MALEERRPRRPLVMPPSDSPDIDRALTEAIRRAYVRPVDGHVAARHVSAMAAAAREADVVPASPSGSPPRPRLRSWRPAFATGLAVLASPAGLAAAGVTLPAPISAPYDAVGLELPNQDGKRATSPGDGRPAIAPSTREADRPARTTVTPSVRRQDRERGGSERPSERGAQQGERNRGGAANPDRGLGEGQGRLRPPQPTERQQRSRPGKPAGTPGQAAPKQPAATTGGRSGTMTGGSRATEPPAPRRRRARRERQPKDRPVRKQAPVPEVLSETAPAPEIGAETQTAPAPTSG